MHERGVVTAMVPVAAVVAAGTHTEHKAGEEDHCDDEHHAGDDAHPGRDGAQSRAARWYVIDGRRWGRRGDRAGRWFGR
jgi:hypothetical protein